MNPMKILLVDDSKSARYALRLQLQRHGTEVETADSAEAALERIKEAHPDAVFMDHTMPGMNGFEALDILKASAETAHIPVVMCTSNEDPGFISQAKQKGALDILPKSTAPERLPQLITRMEQILSGKPAEAAPEPAAAPVSAAASVPAAGITAEIAGKISDLAQAEVRRRIEAVLDLELEKRVEAALMPVLTDYGERLTADVLHQAEGRLENRMAQETQRLEHRLESTRSQPSPQPADQRVLDLIPEAVAEQLRKEQQGLAQMVQELIDHSLDGLTDDPAFMQRIVGLAESKAMQVAEETAQKQLDGLASSVGLGTNGGASEGLNKATQSGLRTAYILAAVAAILGVGASGLVYFLLS